MSGGVHNVGIAFYTREESTQFKDVIVKRSGKDVTLGNVLQERKTSSSRNLKQQFTDLTLEEKPIHEKQIKELVFSHYIQTLFERQKGNTKCLDFCI
jgi:hypothetical protein